MKITILALHLGYGGIEKFISNISNMLNKDNEVEIISIYKLYDEPPFPINKNVKITYLLDGLKPNKNEFISSLKKHKIFDVLKQSYIALKILYLKKYKMKQAIKKIDSDIIISTIAPHNKLVSKYAHKNIKKIATEHNYNFTNTKYISNVIKSCKNIDYLVIASKKLANMYSEKMQNMHCKVKNISLGLDQIPNELSNLNNKSITYIGRLSMEKGVLDLIEVFKKINEKDNSIILNIVGDGDLYNDIEEKIKEYDLEKNVILHGYKVKDELKNILLNTSIGINTSYTESFGLAIIEMFSYGIPCVAFSSAEGTTEIIDDETDGYIIKERNKEMMAERVVELINNETKLKQFGINAKEKSLKYEEKTIKSQWDELLN